MKEWINYCNEEFVVLSKRNRVNLTSVYYNREDFGSINTPISGHVITFENQNDISFRGEDKKDFRHPPKNDGNYQFPPEIQKLLLEKVVLPPILNTAPNTQSSEIRKRFEEGKLILKKKESRKSEENFFKIASDSFKPIKPDVAFNKPKVISTNNEKVDKEIFNMHDQSSPISNCIIEPKESDRISNNESNNRSSRDYKNFPLQMEKTGPAKKVDTSSETNEAKNQPSSLRRLFEQYGKEEITIEDDYGIGEPENMLKLHNEMQFCTWNNTKNNKMHENKADSSNHDAIVQIELNRVDTEVKYQTEIKAIEAQIKINNVKIHTLSSKEQNEDNCVHSAELIEKLNIYKTQMEILYEENKKLNRMYALLVLKMSQYEAKSCISNNESEIESKAVQAGRDAIKSKQIKIPNKNSAPKSFDYDASKNDQGQAVLIKTEEKQGRLHSNQEVPQNCKNDAFLNIQDEVYLKHDNYDASMDDQQELRHNIQRNQSPTVKLNDDLSSIKASRKPSNNGQYSYTDKRLFISTYIPEIKSYTKIYQKKKDCMMKFNTVRIPTYDKSCSHLHKHEIEEATKDEKLNSLLNSEVHRVIMRDNNIKNISKEQYMVLEFEGRDIRKTTKSENNSSNKSLGNVLFKKTADSNITFHNKSMNKPIYSSNSPVYGNNPYLKNIFEINPKENFDSIQPTPAEDYYSNSQKMMISNLEQISEKPETEENYSSNINNSLLARQLPKEEISHFTKVNKQENWQNKKVKAINLNKALDDMLKNLNEDQERDPASFNNCENSISDSMMRQPAVPQVGVSIQSESKKSISQPSQQKSIQNMSQTAQAINVSTSKLNPAKIKNNLKNFICRKSF